MLLGGATEDEKQFSALLPLVRGTLRFFAAGVLPTADYPGAARRIAIGSPDSHDRSTTQSSRSQARP